MNESSPPSLLAALDRRLAAKLSVLRERATPPRLQEEGTLIRMVGLKLEAVGCHASIGSRCQVITDPAHITEAEVVGFADGNLLLMAEGAIDGVRPGARVIPIARGGRVDVGEEMMGRVIDGAGNFIDEERKPSGLHSVPLRGLPINPMNRKPIAEPLDVGVRAINALLTIGRGQRLGLFAGSGVGKSTLLGMMTCNTEADVVVVAMIGERGREVREFIDHVLGPKGLQKAIVVATPADDAPLKRVHGAWRATAIAEYFRNQGKNVLLLMDSLTRFAQAQREIGLAIGEPPVTKGYPPSVFSLLPKLVERAGNGDHGCGSITAIYTVLVEGDDHNDPVADAARAILDGHIVLSRDVADSGIFPAIDIESSISRSMHSVVDSARIEFARQFKSLYATFRQNRDLINIGAYKRGTDAEIDRAIACMPALRDFIRQDRDLKVDMQQSLQAMDQLIPLIAEKRVT